MSLFLVIYKYNTFVRYLYRRIVYFILLALFYKYCELRSNGYYSKGDRINQEKGNNKKDVPSAPPLKPLEPLDYQGAFYFLPQDLPLLAIRNIIVTVNS